MDKKENKKEFEGRKTLTLKGFTKNDVEDLPVRPSDKQGVLVEVKKKKSSVSPPPLKFNTSSFQPILDEEVQVIQEDSVTSKDLSEDENYKKKIDELRKRSASSLFTLPSVPSSFTPPVPEVIEEEVVVKEPEESPIVTADVSDLEILLQKESDPTRKSSLERHEKEKSHDKLKIFKKGQNDASDDVVKGVGFSKVVKEYSDRRKQGKVHLSSISEYYDASDRVRSKASLQRARQKGLKKKQELSKEKIAREVLLPETIQIADLANRMAERSSAVLKVLFNMGVVVMKNHYIDADIAELVIEEMGHTFRKVSDSDAEISLLETLPEEGVEYVRRPPVIVVMGHVDHGKTSLLDAIRNTENAKYEMGGITQRVGAYSVECQDKKLIFLDTPGHAAFYQMRRKGSSLMDVVVIVIAGDDDIQPQTKESIRLSKEYGVPIVIAVTKSDLRAFDSDMIRQKLLSEDIVVEDLGGDALCVSVSSRTGEGIAHLEESILLQSEMLDLEVPSNTPARGRVIESFIEEGRGVVLNVILKSGVLKKGDVFVAGDQYGRVRLIVDDKANHLDIISVFSPFQVLGCQAIPIEGDDFIVVNSISEARRVCAYRQAKEHAERTVVSRDQLGVLFNKQEKVAKELPVVLKVDIHGSLDVLVSAFAEMGNEEVSVKILHKGVGNITDADLHKAASSPGAIVVGFNVRKVLYDRESVFACAVIQDSIIYSLMNKIREKLSNLLDPQRVEESLGHAEIREIFEIYKQGKIAGSFITKGKVVRGEFIRVTRGGVTIGESKIKHLRHFKKDVPHLSSGYECGINIDGSLDIKVGDKLECFSVSYKPRYIDEYGIIKVR